MTLTDFLLAIDNVLFFEYKNGVLTAATLDPEKQPESPLCYTDAELLAIDRRLPVAIEGLVQAAQERRRKIGLHMTFGSAVRNTILLWQGNHVMTTLSGNQVPYRWIVGFNDVDLGGVTPRVRIIAEVMHVRSFTGSDGTTVDIAHITGDEDHLACPDWLEKHYPGWKTRYLLAKALDYDARELHAFLMTAPDAVETVEPGSIEFE